MSEISVFLALGTNLGNRSKNLAEARRRLSQKITILRTSHIYETPPWGVTDQPAFYNQVIETQTGMEPLELLQWVKQIECEMGRVPSVRFGPRLIDIDLLVYDNLVLTSEKLTLPHPRMFERSFVLVPFSELAPYFIPPTSTRSIQELCATIDSQGIIRLEENHG